MLTILATVAEEEFRYPDEPVGWTIYIIVGIVIFAAYVAIKRTRQRFREDYIRKLNWEKQLRENDPDMKKDD